MISVIKQSSAFGILRDDLIKLSLETKDQSKTINTLSTLVVKLEERNQRIDEAIKYNQEWRHTVAGDFMKEVAAQVSELDKNVSILNLKIGVVEKELLRFPSPRN